MRVFVAVLAAVAVLWCAPVASAAPDEAVVVDQVERREPFNWIQNQLWWFGVPNPAPPPQTDVLVLYPWALVPGFLKPVLQDWFSEFNFEACVFGATLRVGPYGTSTVSFGRGCA